MIRQIQNGGVWQVGTTKTFEYWATTGSSRDLDDSAFELCPAGTNVAVLTWYSGYDAGYVGVYQSDKETTAPSGLTITETELATNHYRVTVVIPANYPTGTYYLRNARVRGGAHATCLIA